DLNAEAKIYYTLDGSEPSERSAPYSAPLTINKTTTINALAINQKGVKSRVAEATYNLIPNDWSVMLATKYNRQYTGGGDEGLIDGIRGTTSFASGEWQGYQPDDLIATIDLKKDTTVSEVGGGFLQNARSWIWMPTHIEFETSTDGVNFNRVADIKTDVAVDDMNETIRDYSAKIRPVTARYVRVHAHNLGKIPAWHPGAGNDAFIFVDEVWVK
ncbi:MAG TPA: chitobiase/beta-hexosaminidase C-terminal domain-containing protein, partial [Pyrinomonadaceae bacterium]|nr:chitobiase/beta-hexosaminidase C-terminal domain-containing protein [Pyrinomonadaceae bacterium]